MSLLLLLVHGTLTRDLETALTTTSTLGMQVFSTACGSCGFMAHTSSRGFLDDGNPQRGLTADIQRILAQHEVMGALLVEAGDRFHGALLPHDPSVALDVHRIEAADVLLSGSGGFTPVRIAGAQRLQNFLSWHQCRRPTSAHDALELRRLLGRMPTPTTAPGNGMFPKRSLFHRSNPYHALRRP